MYWGATAAKPLSRTYFEAHSIAEEVWCTGKEVFIAEFRALPHRLEAHPIAARFLISIFFRI